MGEATKIGPPMVWPLAHYLSEEMEARNWTCVHVAKRMTGDYGMNVMVLNLLMAVQKDNMILDDDLLKRIAKAFRVSPTLFINLHATWKRWPNARQPFSCPEKLLDGILFLANDDAPAPPGGAG